MDDQAEQLSRSIEAVSRAIAQWTVSRHEEVDPGLPQRYGASWRSEWVADVQARLALLAQALSMQRPELFAESVAWTGEAFAAREIRVEDLATSLRCLREVVEAELPETVAEAVGRCVDAALAALSNGHANADEAAIGDMALRYLEAVLDGRPDDASDLVLGAAESGTPVRSLYLDVLAPAQAELGRLWHAGDLSIADEHQATALTQQVMSRLRAWFPMKPSNGRSLVAAAVGGDLHDVGVRMVADFFTMDGWEAVFLGANVPMHDLVTAVIRHRVDLLAISVSTNQHLRSLGQLLRELRREPELESLRIIVGGPPLRATPELAVELGADGSASSADEAVALGNRLVG